MISKRWTVIAVSVIIVIVIILASVTFLTVNQNQKPEESLAESMVLRAGDVPPLKNMSEHKADYVYAFKNQSSSCRIMLYGDYNSSTHLSISPIIRVFNTTQAALEAFNFASSYFHSNCDGTTSISLGDEGYMCRRHGTFYDTNLSYVIFIKGMVFCELIIEHPRVLEITWISDYIVDIAQLQLAKIDQHLAG